MLFSIITVTYNADKLLEKTITSVYSQSITDYEYIIIDGKSNDNTIEIANLYKEAFAAKKIDYCIVSEKDYGIYDAMNKGAILSHGEYILFLNAGDTFYANEILEVVKKKYNEKKSDIVYGDCIKTNGRFYQLSRAIDIGKVFYRMPFCHQSAFTAREWLIRFPFNTRYKICADQDFFAKCVENGASFYNIGFPISVFLSGGVSGDGDSFVYLNERNEVAFRHGKISEEEYSAKKRSIMAECRKERYKLLLRRFIPKPIYNKYLIWRGWVNTLPDVQCGTENEEMRLWD